MENLTSIIDKPIENETEDSFETQNYLIALSQFIENAETPLTIALQGEWGSGKTSLMNRLKNSLEGKKFKAYWINTWEHALMKDNPIKCIMSILEAMICSLSQDIPVDKRENIKNTVSSTFKILGAIALNCIGNQIGDNNIGTRLIQKGEDGANDTGSNSIPEHGISDLKKAIGKITQTIVTKENAQFEKVVFFIDDLDRIDPPIAVQILELLKNIFDSENCIFVLAIDYEVVVKGLKPKFGELNESNAREFRSFFDKIIQVPFSMPLGAYKIETFLKEKLKAIHYLEKSTSENSILIKNLSTFTLNSIGNNPRSLKRLMNILSLVKLIMKKQEFKVEEYLIPQNLIEQIVYALVCVQIAYPSVYNMLVKYPEFTEWQENLNASNENGIAKEFQFRTLTNEETQMIEKLAKRCDEEWERVLFKICMRDKNLLARFSNISDIFNKIRKLVRKEIAIKNIQENQAEEYNNLTSNIIASIIPLCSITNVNINMDNVKTAFKPIENMSALLKNLENNAQFGKALETEFKNQNITCQCTNKKFVKIIYHELNFTNQNMCSLRQEFYVHAKGYVLVNYFYDYEKDIFKFYQGATITSEADIEKYDQLLACPNLAKSIQEKFDAIVKREQDNDELTVSIGNEFKDGFKNGKFSPPCIMFTFEDLGEFSKPVNAQRMAKIIGEVIKEWSKMFKAKRAPALPPPEPIPPTTQNQPTQYPQPQE